MEILVSLVLLAVAVLMVITAKNDSMSENDGHSQFFFSNERGRKNWEKAIRKRHQDNSIEVLTFVFGVKGNNWCLLNKGVYIFRVGENGNITQNWFFAWDAVEGYELLPNFDGNFWAFQLKVWDNNRLEHYNYYLPLHRVAQVRDDLIVISNTYMKKNQ